MRLHHLSLALVALATATTGLPAQADTPDTDFDDNPNSKRIRVTALFDSAYFGSATLSDGPVSESMDMVPTLGGGLRVEGLVLPFLALGVGSSLLSWGTKQNAALDIGRTARFDVTAHAKLRGSINNGQAAYYLLGRAGYSYNFVSDDDLPSGNGFTLRSGNNNGWVAGLAGGVEALVRPNFGCLVEFGWMHYEFPNQIDITTATDSTKAKLTTNQFSLVIGYFVPF